MNNEHIDMTPSYYSCRIERLIEYNKNLDRQLGLLQLSESIIEANLEELESILSVSDRIERYSLYRLMELTLFCVGNYANNNCITEVGDFMVNPRLIRVHIKGEAKPIIKERYTPLSVQFKDRDSENCPVGEWLKLNTMTEIVKKPILPYLLKLLKDNGCQEDYIKSVENRMNSIVDLLGHLHMAGIPNRMNIEEWKVSLEDDDRIMMDKLFYKFDPIIFYDLGEKIQKFSKFCVTV